MTYNDFLFKLHEIKVPKSLRLGQYVFNVLQNIKPDLANLVRGSDIDPFYDNTKLEKFYAFIQEHWDHRRNHDKTK